MKSPFVCIIGVDGCGKTTHVRKIMDKLKNEGKPCKYTWFRFQNYLSLSILVYCRLVGLTVYEMQGDKRISIHEFYRSKLISSIYPIILFIDMIPSYILKIHLPLLLGYTVVCDRCAYDTIVDLMVDLNNPELHKNHIGKLFKRLVPKEAKIVLLDLDEKIIRERRKELVQDHTLEIRRQLYHQLSKEYQIPIVNNEAKISEVEDTIYRTMAEI